METFPTDFGNLNIVEYYNMFGRTRMERALNMLLNGLILDIVPDLPHGTIYYVVLSQTWPITGVVHIVEWRGFMHNSECTCADFNQRNIVCKHLHCVRINNLF